jgi:hypothetical protein
MANDCKITAHSAAGRAAQQAACDARKDGAEAQVQAVKDERLTGPLGKARKSTEHSWRDDFMTDLALGYGHTKEGGSEFVGEVGTIYHLKSDKEWVRKFGVGGSAEFWAGGKEGAGIDLFPALSYDITPHLRASVGPTFEVTKEGVEPNGRFRLGASYELPELPVLGSGVSLFGRLDVNGPKDVNLGGQLGACKELEFLKVPGSEAANLCVAATGGLSLGKLEAGHAEPGEEPAGKPGRFDPGGTAYVNWSF